MIVANFIRSAALVITMGIWLSGIGVLIYTPSEPIVFLGGDSVTPKAARIGDTITVVRSFRIRRDDPLVVTRAMISGDCSRSCEIVDLPGSNLALAPGEYLNVARDHVIPPTAEPGRWTLQFSVLWRDHINREHKSDLAPLDIQIIR